MGTKQRAREMMMAAMTMMAKIKRRLTGMDSQMTVQLEVLMLELVPRRLLVIEVFATSNPQRTMMMFAVVMTEATAMYAMEMVMTATTMCRTKMVKRLPTTLLVVVMSRLLLKGHRTTSLDSLSPCP
jgi:hypothetical protein